jgi:hypothetical protein
MKHIFVIIAAMFFSSVLYGQVHVNFNLGGQPSWGHSGYNSHRVMIYHRLPLRYHVVYRDRYYDNRGPGYYGNQNNSGYDNYPMQKPDNGKHEGWNKGNNGNGNGNGNDNGYYNGNDNGNGKGNYNDKGSGNGNGNYNDKGNVNGNGNDGVPDKYPYK